MEKLRISLLAAMLLSLAGNVSAWWGGGWNPYYPWDLRYWLEEFFGGGHYGGPWGHGSGPWGYGGPWVYGGGWPYAGWAPPPYLVPPASATGDS